MKKLKKDYPASALKLKEWKIRFDKNNIYGIITIYNFQFTIFNFQSIFNDLIFKHLKLEIRNLSEAFYVDN